MNTLKNSVPHRVTWSEKKSKLIGLYPLLTETDFNYDIGKRDIMLNKLAAKIDKTRDELESILSSF